MARTDRDRHLLDLLRAESASLAGIAAAAAGGADGGAGLAAPVASCPGWHVADTVGHTGTVHRRVTALLEGTDASSLPDPPGAAALVDWFRAGADALAAALDRRDPDDEVWTFSSVGDRTVRWWLRRQALETALHRVDVADATGGAVGPLDARLAVEGIRELLVDFLPRAVAGPDGDGAGPLPGGTLHLHATDVDDGGEWLVDLSARPVDVREGHAKADTAVRGPASALLLRLWNRPPGAPLEVFGSPAVLDGWAAIRF
ncbi:MAG TPA: maleylpyruvate isomerase N-terminal domain-containing protein [Acidimicrobiales bacterium]|nr:maleylpyruvate isomerase N-terminal domain-containing protein [Acidimicrobiales bacterium]